MEITLDQYRDLREILYFLDEERNSLKLAICDKNLRQEMIVHMDRRIQTLKSVISKLTLNSSEGLANCE
jgi:hypothetical protein